MYLFMLSFYNDTVMKIISWDTFFVSDNGAKFVSAKEVWYHFDPEWPGSRGWCV